MRVAIPSNDEKNIAAHTGRCKGFVIVDIDDKQASRVEYRSNTFTHHAQEEKRVSPALLGMEPETEKTASGLGFPGFGHSKQQGQGGHHHSHRALTRAMADCQAMVALGMGPRLLQDLEQQGIDVYFTRDRDIDRVVSSLAHGDFVSHPEGSACKHPHEHGGH